MIYKIKILFALLLINLINCDLFSQQILLQDKNDDSKIVILKCDWRYDIKSGSDKYSSCSIVELSDSTLIIKDYFGQQHKLLISQITLIKKYWIKSISPSIQEFVAWALLINTLGLIAIPIMVIVDIHSVLNLATLVGVVYGICLPPLILNKLCTNYELSTRWTLKKN